MNTKLIALALIAIGTVPAITAEVAEGAAFEVPSDQAELLLTNGMAKLAEDPPASKVKSTRARLLQDCVYGVCNDVADIPNAELKQLKADGVIDDNKEAVAYALSLKKPAA